CARDHSAFDYW
nr:immunoglobulin heavy chain junction region [Macaca mulatta]MOW98305.1 immunoglobulin heavy chain junction region [Macaca mulatta]MOW98309.1 immunoglobulin heavy chain junction region [Macaca mulatta]MOW98848.1 immunoglobulin heavy chain junction region [Macaca mulatta]MOW98875.1 immunoglobulin heavy chain junction region [Macaca mulatta]